jgi:hypothetical protein
MFNQVIANIILWLHWSKMAPPDPFWIECHTGDSLLNLGDGNILTMSSSQHNNNLSDNTKEERKALLNNMAAVAIDLASISKFKTNLLKETIEGMIAKLSLEYSGSMIGTLVVNPSAKIQEQNQARLVPVCGPTTKAYKQHSTLIKKRKLASATTKQNTLAGKSSAGCWL